MADLYIYHLHLDPVNLIAVVNSRYIPHPNEILRIQHFNNVVMYAEVLTVEHEIQLTKHKAGQRHAKDTRCQQGAQPAELLRADRSSVHGHPPFKTSDPEAIIVDARLIAPLQVKVTVLPPYSTDVKLASSQTPTTPPVCAGDPARREPARRGGPQVVCVACSLSP